MQVAGSATVVNSTFAGNTAGRPTAGTFTGRWLPRDQGSISDADGGLLRARSPRMASTWAPTTRAGTNRAVTDIEEATTGLGALQDNSGPDAGGTTGDAAVPVPTREADIGTSDAIDRITAGSCTDDSAATLAVDQRNASRPYDGDGDSIQECDSGAVEVRRVKARRPRSSAPTATTSGRSTEPSALT